MTKVSGQGLNIPGYYGFSELPIYSYFYISRQEVRHELIIKASALEEWIEVGRAQADRISIDEQKVLQEALIPLIADNIPIKINKVLIEPKLIEAKLGGFELLEDPSALRRARVLPFAMSWIAIALSYSSEGFVKDLEVHWELVPRESELVVSNFYYGDLRIRKNFTQALPHYRWEAPKEFVFKIPEPVHVNEIGSVWGAVVGLVTFLIASIFLTAASLNGYSGRKQYKQAGIIASLVLGFSLLVTFYSIRNAQIAKREELKKVAEAVTRNIYQALEAPSQNLLEKALRVSLDSGSDESSFKKLSDQLLIRDRGRFISHIQKLHFNEAVLAAKGDKELKVLNCRWEIEGMLFCWGHQALSKITQEGQLELVQLENTWRLRKIKLIKAINRSKNLQNLED
ncbi:MAG: hypothetical protein AAGA18_11235 [Verrucomicrobiota bacterium]